MGVETGGGPSVTDVEFNTKPEEETENADMTPDGTAASAHPQNLTERHRAQAADFRERSARLMEAHPNDRGDSLPIMRAKELSRQADQLEAEAQRAEALQNRRSA